ncbi:MAG TPA: hypothetical protein VL093_14720 [Flavipsychrobacter sp.]|nr:hypothetical protein [Flavipsychrobacter sp.]
MSQFLKRFLFIHLIISLVMTTQGLAQDYKYRFGMGDSLLTDKKERVIINNLRIYNINNKYLQMGVQVKVPHEWRLIGGKESSNISSFLLKPVDTFILPLNLVRNESNTNGWQRIEVKVFQRQIKDTQTYYYYIGTAVDYGLVVNVDDEPITVETKDTVSLQAYVKNTGNIAQKLTLNWNSLPFNLNENEIFTLQPGRDTFIKHYIKVANNAFRESDRVGVALTIFQGGKLVNQYPFTLVHPQSRVTAHTSAYDLIPITLQGGYINSGPNYSYYGGISGSYVFSNDDRVQFGYRTKQMGTVTNTLESNPFYLRFQHKQLTVNAGQVSAPYGFQAYGQGVSVEYKTENKTNYRVQGIVHNNALYQADNYSGEVNYHPGKFDIQHGIVYNRDMSYQKEDFMQYNQLAWHPNDNWNVQLNAAADAGKYTDDPQADFGYGGGYLASYKSKSLEVSSAMQRFNPAMPGLYKGLQSQLHSLKWKFDERSLGIFYSSNKLMQNIYRDSFFNSDIFSYNMEQWGITGSWTKQNKFFVTATLGMMNGQALFSGLSNFYSADASFGMKTGNVDLNLNLRNGIGKTNGSEKIAFANSTDLSFRSKVVSLNANYNRFPTASAEHSSDVVETVNGNANVYFGLWRKHLQGTLGANAFKTLSQESINYGLGGSLKYISKGGGLLIDLTANIPLKSTKGEFIPLSNQKSIMLTVSKNLNIPVLFRKKYSDLNVLVFNDANSNGRHDHNEEMLPQVKMDISGSAFITDGSGKVRYKNIEEKGYDISFVNSGVTGFVPTGGVIQQAEVGRKRKIVEVPFKQGKMLTGNIAIVQDSFSKANFTPDGIKIIVIDTSGNTYYSLTDRNGDFSFALPAGIYNVSLNPKIFENSYFKPEKSTFTVDFTDKESESIQFVIKQNKRRIRNVKFD